MAGDKQQQYEPLTNEELQGFRRRLMAKREQLLQDVQQARKEIDEQSDSAASVPSPGGVPTHPADLAQDDQASSRSLDIMDHQRRVLQDVDDALRRMNDGTYGRCVAGEHPIGRARLQAKPWAAFCIEHANLERAA